MICLGAGPEPWNMILIEEIKGHEGNKVKGTMDPRSVFRMYLGNHAG